MQQFQAFIENNDFISILEILWKWFWRRQASPARGEDGDAEGPGEECEGVQGDEEGAGQAEDSAGAAGECQGEKQDGENPKN